KRTSISPVRAAVWRGFTSLLLPPLPMNLKNPSLISKRFRKSRFTAAMRVKTFWGRLIKTPLQRGVRDSDVLRNPFNGFAAAMETVKTVSNLQETAPTPLKRGVNESRRFDLLSVPLLGSFLRAQTGRRFLRTLLFIIAIAVIVDGLFGPQVSSANLAGVLP